MNAPSDPNTQAAPGLHLQRSGGRVMHDGRSAGFDVAALQRLLLRVSRLADDLSETARPGPEPGDYDPKRG
jgi:hypothetical protein